MIDNKRRRISESTDPDSEVENSKKVGLKIDFRRKLVESLRLVTKKNLYNFYSNTLNAEKNYFTIHEALVYKEVPTAKYSWNRRQSTYYLKNCRISCVKHGGLEIAKQYVNNCEFESYEAVHKYLNDKFDCFIPEKVPMIVTEIEFVKKVIRQCRMLKELAKEYLYQCTASRPELEDEDSMFCQFEEEFASKEEKGCFVEWVYNTIYGLTSASEKRGIEEENLKNNRIVDELSVFEFNFIGKTIHVPRDIMEEIMSYVHHDRKLVDTVGLVNQQWYLLCLWTWDNVTLRTPQNIQKVPIIVVHRLKRLECDFTRSKISGGWRDRVSEFCSKLQNIRSISVLGSGATIMLKLFIENLTDFAIKLVNEVDLVNVNNLEQTENLRKLSNVMCKKLKKFPNLRKFSFCSNDPKYIVEKNKEVLRRVNALCVVVDVLAISGLTFSYQLPNLQKLCLYKVKLSSWSLKNVPNLEVFQGQVWNNHKFPFSKIRSLKCLFVEVCMKETDQRSFLDEIIFLKSLKTAHIRYDHSGVHMGKIEDFLACDVANCHSVDSKGKPPIIEVCIPQYYENMREEGSRQQGELNKKALKEFIQTNSFGIVEVFLDSSLGYNSPKRRMFSRCCFNSSVGKILKL